MTSRLTHLDDAGNARMVDVSGKASTRRVAVASVRVEMQAETLDLILRGEAPKGDVLATVRIAGIMAAKRTADLIPLCHPLAIASVELNIAPVADEPAMEIRATVATTGPTGVEMEALTAASVAALTLYDMVKAVDRAMTITDLKLLSKTGGRSGRWSRET